jgi:hypothetical protein
MVAEPLLPSADAVTLVVPAPTAVTSPLALTAATAVFAEDQTKVAAAFFGDAVAVSCTV